MLFYQIYTIKKYERINKAEETLLANVTHDLKSPVVAQVNILNLMLNGAFGQLTPKQQEMLKLTCDSGKYMTNLVGTIMDSYKCKNPKFKLKYSNFNINDVITSVCADNEYLAAEKGQDIIFNSYDKNTVIYADKLQIERVIFNLVSNAITYGNKNTPIILNLKILDGIIKLTISNSTSYISPQDLKTIFERFSRGANSSFNTSGSGIGLYVSKKIINMHRGKIYANLNKNIITIGFDLPLKSENEIIISKYQKSRNKQDEKQKTFT